MVPDIAKTGHSFRGAMSYYLHDKREPGEDARATAERVAWTETRNLITDAPHTATRIMIATAERADELKAAAGVKATGRKSNAHVYAYSLAWHPDEAAALDRAEMLRAVDQTLKALGAEQHQAVIVCHRDQEHPHVHVVLNRVHPETGKMLTTSNDRRKLSEWAARYERERGVIVTPNRQDRQQEIEKKREAARTQAAFTQAATGPTPTKQVAQAHDRTAPATPAQTRPASSPAKTPSEAAILKELTDAQRARHKQEWAEIVARNKAQRSAAYATYGQAIKDAADENKRRAKPAWAAYFKAARMDERAFFARERSIVGVLQNAIAVTPLGARGRLAGMFGNVLSAKSREAAFRAAQEGERAGLARDVKVRLDAEITAIKTERAAKLKAQSVAYAKERAGLIERQTAEKEKTRKAWRQVYQRCGRDPRWKGRPTPQPQEATAAQTVSELRAAYGRAVEGKSLAEKKARSRSEKQGRGRSFSRRFEKE